MSESDRRLAPEGASRGRTISDEEVLDTEFVPPELNHRDDAIGDLMRAFNPTLRGRAAQTAIITGPPGSGKTCVAQYAPKIARRELGADLAYHRVDCWKNSKRLSALQRVVEGFGDVGELYPRVDHLLQRIDDYSGTHLVVILDDVDRLEDHNVLHDLHQASNVSMVLTAADESDLFDSFSSRLRSRLQVSNPVRLRSYRTDELVSILKDRVRWGLKDDAIDEAGLEQIANAAAGDARSAIEILRWAAEIAERVNQSKITSKTVEKAIPPEEYGPRNRYAAKLSGHHRTLYEIVREHTTITPSDLYSAYRERVDGPRTDRTVRRYLSNLRRRELIVKEGKGRTTSYRLPDGEDRRHVP
jgi:Cdc6-like AAA superfamily ATPase